jgi:broad specificity phosphatase PhoE
MAEGSEVWLVRHAESEANATNLWQGRIDGVLTPRGAGQIELLARRVANLKFDLILSSPLQRARKTAAAFGDHDVDDDLAEIDLGGWEGLTTDDILKNHRDDLDEVVSRLDVRFGKSGETRSEITSRIEAVIDRVFATLGPEQKAVIVTHGGLLDAITDRTFGRDQNGRRVGSLTANTGITRLVERLGLQRIASFNDTGHLGPRPLAVQKAHAAGSAVVALIRHGQTAANVDGRWQGRSDGGLDEVGLRQARSLAAWYGAFDRVVTSPLGRAEQTALALHPSPETVEGLAELGFGRWEGLTVDEIRRDWSALFDRIFLDRSDLPRGETGETWAQLAERVGRALLTIDPRQGEITAVVTHGAAMRAYLAALSGGGWSHAATLDTPANASVTHVIVTHRGPVVVDYSSAAHLESLRDR